MATVFRMWSEEWRGGGDVATRSDLNLTPAPDAAEDLPSREFGGGRYVLERRLGGGAASDVFRAADRLLRRPVAVKLYRPGAGRSAERRFREGARALARLEHGNLVTLYDAGIERGIPFLVLQFVDGVSLDRRLAQGPLSIGQTIAVGRRLSDVLAHVHGHGVVHRDIRPASVLVEQHDVYLSAVGIWRMLGGAHLTSGGLARSTSAYLAPEQLRGTAVGPAADLYSLGLILLECLTGEVQYPGGALTTAVAHLNRRPRIPDGLPEPLRDALEAMIAEAPGERPTAEECGAAFALCDPSIPQPVPFEDVWPPGAAPAPGSEAPDEHADAVAGNVYAFPPPGSTRRSGRAAHRAAGEGQIRSRGRRRETSRGTRPPTPR